MVSKAPELSPYSHFIHKSRYARWDHEKQRRENWDETVARYVGFFSPRIPKADREAAAAEIEKAILHMDVMPSMRAMMTAGPALEKDNAAGYNPVAGSTGVVTREYGNVPIRELTGRSATVLNQKGAWTEAAFRSYGHQPTYSVKFKMNSNTEKTVQCTGNHRWALQDGSVVPTDGLQPKDRVNFVPAPKPAIDDDYMLGVRHGLVYGDGTSVKSCKRVKGYHIRLCSDSKELLWCFEGYPVSYPPTFNGDPVVFLFDGFAATHELKSLPAGGETESYLLGFIRGWLAADGSVGKVSSEVSICTANEGLQWLLTNSERLGFTVRRFSKQPAETNYGKRKEDSYVVFFCRSSMVAEDFLCSWKRDNFKPLTSYFTVSGVAPTGEMEEVFCAEVPDTNTFVLEGGILTGNCTYVAVDDPRAFDEAMYLSMCGCGVGFSVERQYVNQMPVIAENFYPVDTVIKVRDSKIGWANSLRQLIQLLYGGSIPSWDLSAVRPAGSVLKTMGGRASGPEPLDRLFKFCVNLFREAAGRKLNSIECHDLMCMVADIVVVGGVRRSAMLSLSNLSDDRMRNAKSGAWWDEKNPNSAPWRSLANNSVAYTEKPEPHIFIREFLTLIESKSGERGIFNRVAATNSAKKTGRRRWENIDFGTNPCGEINLRPKGFCVAKTTPLIGKNTLMAIGEHENETVTIWNGDRWSDVIVRKTGVSQPLVRVEFSDGSFLDCTPDHGFSVKTRFQKGWRRVEAAGLQKYSPYAVQVQPTTIRPETGGLEVQHAYALGFCVGDGTTNGTAVTADLYGTKDQVLPLPGSRGMIHTPAGYGVAKQRLSCTKYVNAVLLASLKTDTKAIDQLFGWSRESVLEFIAGWIDADGSETGTGGIRLYLSVEERARKVQLLLTKNGIRSSVNLLHKAGTKTNLGVRKHDLWYLQITDARGIPSHRVDVSGGHPAKFKGKYQTIRSVTPLPGLHDVYCFSEPQNHMAVFGNVLTYQCNLSEVVVRPHDTKATLRRKIRIATIIGCLQSTLTEFRYLRREWQKNAEEERLLGVSLTGIMDCELTSRNGEELAKLLDELREYSIEVATEWAGKLNISVPAAITCVKPSGTVSQLVDCSAGIHSRYAPYLLRGTQEDRKSPVNAFLKAQGVPSEPYSLHPDQSDMFFFPMEAPKTSVCRSSMTALDQLEFYLTYKLHWTEHNPSCTIYVREKEWTDVLAWVFKHFDVIGGVSFMPHSDHIYKQAPYRELTEEEYGRMKASFPAIDWSKLPEFEKEDMTTPAREPACSAGACELA